jgi:hypothetical protein
MTQPRTLDQQPAEQDAGGGGESANRAPSAECGVAVLAFPERRGEDRQRGGQRHRCAQALGQACADQDAGTVRKPADE